MTKQTIDRIRLVYGAVLSVLLVVTGVLMICACVGVYRSGERPFSPESVAAAFSRIAVPVWITVAALVVGAVFSLVYPPERARVRAHVEKRDVLSRLAARAGDVQDAVVARERKLRRVCLIVVAALLAALLTVALCYVLDFDHYGANYNAAVVAAMCWLLPLSATAAGLSLAYLCVADASRERECKALRALMAAGETTPSNGVKKPTEKCGRALLAVRVTVAVLALALIVAGALNGGFVDVLAKAIAICTECIGLG